MILSYKLKHLMLLALLSLSGCAERKNDPVVADQDNLDAAVEYAQSVHIAQVAADFFVQLQSLGQAAEILCAAPSETTLVDAQSAWKNTNEAWFALANYKFGPLQSAIVFAEYTFIDALRVRGTNYIASVRAELAEDLASQTTLDAAYYQAKTFQFLGLLPLEVLLFETLTDGDQAGAAIVAEFQQAPRKCDMLLGQIDHSLGVAEQVNRGWQEDYKQTGLAYADYQDPNSEPLAEILTAVQEHMDYLHKRAVVDNAASLAGNIWASLRSAILDVESLLQGDERYPITFFAIMQGAGNQAAVTEIKENIAFALTSIEEQDKVNLALALTLLDGNFKRTIPDALDVNLGINFTDGD